MNEIKQDLPELEVLVNNAGYGISKKFSETPEVDVDGMLAVNMNVLTKLTYRILPSMQNKKRGMILNVASTAAYVPGPYMAIYYASKAYVLSFSEAIHEELKKDGIIVTALCPGYTHSSFHERAGNARLFNGWAPSMSSEQVAKIGYKALLEGKRVAITGFINKLFPWLIYLTPRFISLKIIAFLDTK
jgi:short-subunit dehydrogenase